MANFARRIVSGNKARFVDDELDVDLDLVYVTDNVIIMGYPAEGMEAFYRNDRHDARKFLDHRHADKYWIYNFCPLTENSYPADFFHGRVSRYPFPDHHAPPLAIMALATREMYEWLSGHPDRVIVLHCKAGKGRSGTLACSYLLSLEDIPKGPKLERSHTRKEWANKRAAEMMAAVTSLSSDGDDEGEQEEVAEPPKEAQPSQSGTTLDPERTGVSVVGSPTGAEATGEKEIGPGDNVKITQDALSPTTESETHEGATTTSPPSASPAPSRNPTIAHLGTHQNNAASVNSSSASLDSILALHSARRMKPPSPSKSDSRPRKGVSIPSQRRFLYYWAQILSNAAPKGFWEIPDSQAKAPPPQKMRTSQKVRIRGVTIRMLDPGGAKSAALKVVNNLLAATTGGKVRGKTQSTTGDTWISLARYDDALVNTLEDWEKRTRHPEKMGRRRPGSEEIETNEGEGSEKGIAKLFEGGEWDSGKMVRSFARLGTGKGDVVSSHEEDKKIVTHSLRQLPQSSWINVNKDKKKGTTIKTKAPGGDASSSVSDDSVSTASETGEANLALGQEEVEDSLNEIIVDANREVRAKLYLGQVPMGWFWFVPTFHMKPGGTDVVHLHLKRKELDFPLGAGSWILDVDVAMEWVSEEEVASGVLPTTRQESVSGGDGGREPKAGGIAVAAGLAKLDVREAAETAEAVEQ